VKILGFHSFLTKRVGLFSLPLLVASLSFFLVWANRMAFAGLLPGGKRADS